MSENRPASTEEFIPLSVPELRGNEWLYLKECLDTGWVSSAGPFVERFERQIAAAVGAAHAVAVVNGSAALQIALQVAGVKPGDLVLCSDITFIASANAIRYANAEPVLIDCEPDYWQIDVNLVRRYLSEECERRDGQVFERARQRRVSAIMPVHILGHAVDLAPIQAIAAEYGLPVVEDAAEALGTVYRGRRIGSHGTRATCFSFNGNKILTTGGGGAIVTDDPAVAARAKYLTTQAKDDPVEYIHSEIGYNYRMPNMLAAFGCAQLEMLDSYVEKKREIAARYAEALGGVKGLSVMPTPPYGESTYWLYTIKIDAEGFGEDWRGVLRRLTELNIQTRPLWEPMHMSKVHRDCRFVGSTISENLYRSCLSLPCSVGLSPSDQDRVIRALVQRK
ncbi:DegT/DnrJ/EryC1/StrS family protein [Fimbriimonas ginsengisoli Gsoil 348]|uniref:DegT/DnrJ/EryC1/StrS family protein n=2 Tax=Fimbriimonas ginsengisoli TaxID=1005039 RepID=A0A068NV62_FIMGI|nr:DegT/DnrJ/EryC1/StrS family protein [Fimbriimonas ginsengisoli Gsoil 348]